MGFPVGYTEVFLPKLLINALSLLGLIRRLILTFLHLLGISDFLEPDLVWPDSDPDSFSSSSSSSSSSFHNHHHYNYNYSYSHNNLHYPYTSPSAPPAPLSAAASSLIREMLPAVVKFSDVAVAGSESSEERCAVCLYDFEADEEIRRLTNCRHIFHRCCLDRWMDCDRRTCPLCRTPFVPDELQNTFNERLWAAAEDISASVSDFYGEYLPIPNTL